MKVILLTELKGKGGEGDVVEVARGFANNYLLPQKMAVLATPGNLKQLEMRRKNIAKREEVRIADAEALADAVKAQFDIELDRKRIDLRNPIKVAGMHEVGISLYREIRATLELFVGAEGEPIPGMEPEVEEVAEEAVEVEETEEAAE